MKTLKKIISQYMLRTTGLMVVVILSIAVCIQVALENHGEYDSSVKVLGQIVQYTENTMSYGVDEEVAEEEGKYAYLFALIKSNSDAEYFTVSGAGVVTDTTIPGLNGVSCKEAGLSFDKLTKDEDSFFARIDGELFFCLFRKIGEDYVGRCVRCSTMYRDVPATAFILGFCIITIAIVLVYTVSRYMNRYVVSGIYEINDDLYKISEGNFETKVDVRSSEEFSELSDYINIMVSSLSDTTSKISYVLSKTNMFIGVYEYRKGAKPVRCTEYISRIFSLELDEWRVLTADYELFQTFIDRIREEEYEEEPGVYKIGDIPEQYIKLEEMEIGNEVFGVVIDVTEDVLKRREIEAERDVDLLTGLYNRRGLETQLSLLFRKPEKLGYSALVMLDADGLKGINDTYGHEMGDVYLKKIANVINNFGIHGSLASRQGGDEYVLFLYEYDSEEELVNTIRTLEYVQKNSTARLGADLTVPLRFSMGYCLTEDGMTYEDLMKMADERMYANKRMRKKEAAKNVSEEK